MSITICICFRSCFLPENLQLQQFSIHIAFQHRPSVCQLPGLCFFLCIYQTAPVQSCTSAAGNPKHIIGFYINLIRLYLMPQTSNQNVHLERLIFLFLLIPDILPLPLPTLPDSSHSMQYNPCRFLLQSFQA